MNIVYDMQYETGQLFKPFTYYANLHSDKPKFL